MEMLINKDYPIEDIEINHDIEVEEVKQQPKPKRNNTLLIVLVIALVLTTIVIIFLNIQRVRQNGNNK